jgi:flagellar FliJ protein
MPRFRFRLQMVLEHRARIERDKQGILAAKQRDLQVAQDRLAGLNEDYVRTGEELRLKHAELDTNELYNYYSYLDYVLRGIRSSEERVAACEAEVEYAQRILAEARKQKKILELLKERRRETFDADMLAMEQRDLDDLNARRYGREHSGFGGTP